VHVLQLVHPPLPAAPVQSSPAGQVLVLSTYRQLFASLAHVSSVVELAQRPPTAVQALALHVHDEVDPDVVQVWFVSHVSVVTHARHPFTTWQVCCAELDRHWVEPSEGHVFRQHDAVPAGPVHAPPEHGCELLS
jgi:hypothetical protein